MRCRLLRFTIWIVQMPIFTSAVARRALVAGIRDGVLDERGEVTRATIEDRSSLVAVLHICCMHGGLSSMAP